MLVAQRRIAECLYFCLSDIDVVDRLHAADDGECTAGRYAGDARRFTQQRLQISTDDDAQCPAAAARLPADSSAAGAPASSHHTAGTPAC